MANLAVREAGDYSFYSGQPFAELKFKNPITEEWKIILKYIISAPIAK